MTQTDKDALAVDIQIEHLLATNAATNRPPANIIYDLYIFVLGVCDVWLW